MATTDPELDHELAIEADSSGNIWLYCRWHVDYARYLGPRPTIATLMRVAQKHDTFRVVITTTEVSND